MTLQKGKELLEKSNPSASELRISITALNQEKKYVENCIELGFCEQSDGEKLRKKFPTRSHNLRKN
jgi:hypothetical protein